MLKNGKEGRKSLLFIFLLEYLPKTKQVYSILFLSQYLMRYKQFNFWFYCEIFVDVYIWKAIIFVRFFRDTVFIFGQMKILSKIFYSSLFSVLGNLVHPWDKVWAICNGTQEAKKCTHNLSNLSKLNDHIFSTKNFFRRNIYKL